MELAAEQENPNIIFPNEIWEQIIQNTADTDDIVSLLQVFPQLNGLSEGKRFSWLIGEVMPFLLPKYIISSTDILNCRLVSKIWKNAVGTTFETHPDRLPYKSSRLTRMHENHFCYQPLPKLQTNLIKMLHGDIGSTPQNNNPFLGRYLKIKLFFPERKTKIPPDIHLQDILPVLEKYGHHLHHIYFIIRGSGEFTEEMFARHILCEILSCLSYLSNLKTFKMAGSQLKQFVKKVGENTLDFSAIVNIPTLPKLETVDLSSLAGISGNTYRLFLMTLVTHNQVKKLGLHHAFWNQRLATLFPNINELILDADDAVNAIFVLGQVLQELKPAHLGKLGFRYTGANLFELFQVVTPYNIESLELVGSFPGDKNETGTEIVATSVKDLKMRVYVNQSYQFLQSLPSLEYLYLFHDHADSDGYESDDDFDEDDDDPIKSVKEDWRNLGYYLVGTRAQLDRLDFMWDSMTHLKRITVHVHRTLSQIIRECRNREFQLQYSLGAPVIFYYT